MNGDVRPASSSLPIPTGAMMPSEHDEVVQIVDCHKRKTDHPPRSHMHKHRRDPPTGTFFLHGLDSSSHGTKGRFFREHFPHIACPDFSGPLTDRLDRLAELCQGLAGLTLIGSSFGGLMATCHALRFPEQVARLILLAPALNFPEFQPPHQKLAVPTLLIIGNGDTVTPAAQVIPLAQATFANLEICVEEDDHLLHKSFKNLAWHELLQT